MEGASLEVVDSGDAGKFCFVEDAAGSDEEAIMEVALDAGADDIVSNEDGSIGVMTTLETFGTVQDALRENKLEAEAAEMTMLASTAVDLGLRAAETLLKMIELMEDLDDVQTVYSNANISDEIASQL